MSNKVTAGFVISLIAGILITLNAILILTLGLFGIAFHAVTCTMAKPPFLPIPSLFLIPVVIGVLSGAIVILGSALIRRSESTTGGILVIVFSTLSIFIGGGFLIGFILGIVGGILALLGL